jgi:hypothetical protein
LFKYAAIVVFVLTGICSAQEGCPFDSNAHRDEFLRFDRELRSALKTDDPGKTALLVRYPLRVNDPKGKFEISDPESLALRIHEVFPAKIREIVFKTAPQSVHCMVEGLMYGDGAVWVEWPAAHRLKIISVNLPGDEAASENTVQFTCNADKLRAIVEGKGVRSVRLQLWNNPHELTEKPDMDLTDGTSTMEGTNWCAHAVWNFESSGAHYRLERLGCTEGTPPDGAIGYFESELGDKKEVSTCF